jgi:radical SAM protein with 4Fe4S-binding SPASM domain
VSVDESDELPVLRYGNLLPSNRVEGYCRIMYDRAMVLLDGRVKPCCHSLEMMGSLRDQSFEQIWNGDAYQSLRASFARGVLPDSCRSCNFLRSNQLTGARLV